MQGLDKGMIGSAHWIPARTIFHDERYARFVDAIVVALAVRCRGPLLQPAFCRTLADRDRPDAGRRGSTADACDARWRDSGAARVLALVECYGRSMCRGRSVGPA